MRTIEPLEYGRSTKPERTLNKRYLKELREKAQQMGGKVPKLIYCPGIDRAITAREYCNAIKLIKGVNPGYEFKRSFQNWYPVTARDIMKYEVIPAIHDRINIRGIKP